jgi:hypothetical protein
MPSVIFPPRGIVKEGGPTPAEIHLNCDRHHGIIRLGLQYLHHGWRQPDLDAFVPELW